MSIPLRAGPWLLGALLLVGIVVVELGWRSAQPGVAVAAPVPGVLEPVIARLRAVPLVTIDDADAAAIASGVVFGRTEHVSTTDQQAFLGSGLWHLLAASGQNIALVATCCVLLARGLGCGRTVGAVLALVAIPIYVLIVGGGASIVRAGIMGELGVIAWLLGRLPDARHLLLVVATTIIWIWPGAHRGLGMQLSFACVIALVAWAVPMTRDLRERGVPEWLAAGLAATALCSAATAPILVLRTGAAPLLGMFANVLAVPLAGAILVIGLSGATVTALLEQLIGVDVGRIAMFPTGVLSGLLRDIAIRSAGWPAAQSSSRVLAFGLPLLMLVATRGRIAQRLRSGAALLACLLIVGELVRATAGIAMPSMGLSGHRVTPIEAGQLRIASLDVGQGDATLLATSDARVLVDVGPPDGGVIGELRRLGIERVDGIVLTHDSLDHRGAFEAAHAALRPSWVAMPRRAPGPWERIRAQAPDIIELCAGDGFAVGVARVEVLHPRCDGTIAPKTGDLHNDGAMVLLVSHEDVRALLPADAEAPVLVGLNLPRIDLLRVSHHGSDDPKLPELLARSAPQVATISSGAGNTYGHPTPSTLAALRDAAVRTLRTDREGTIVLDSDGHTLRLAG